MAQLWGGRFTKETDKLVYNFNASINFDKKFYKQDMEGSIAHVKMLASVGILTEEERNQIITGIEGILRDVENGSLIIMEEYEDIHSFVEAVQSVLAMSERSFIQEEAETIRLLLI